MAASRVKAGGTDISPHGRSSAANVPHTIARDLSLAYLASLLIAALMAVVSAAGVLLAPTGLYRGDPIFVSVFVGQDAANLVVGLPILLGSVWLARRGSLIGLLLWPGALFYVRYTYALYLVGAPLNAFFLAYVALAIAGHLHDHRTRGQH